MGMRLKVSWLILEFSVISFQSSPPPRFFVSVASKGVANDMTISANSTAVIVANFSMSWKWLVSADSKGVSDPEMLWAGRWLAIPTRSGEAGDSRG